MNYPDDLCRGRSSIVGGIEKREGHQYFEGRHVNEGRGRKRNGRECPIEFRRSLVGWSVYSGKMNYEGNYRSAYIVQLVGECRDILELSAFFDGQWNKDSFNSICASAFWSCMVRMLISSEHYEMYIEEVEKFSEAIQIFFGSYNERSIANITTWAAKLNEYGESVGVLFFREEGLKILEMGLEEVRSQHNLREFSPQGLANLSNSGRKLCFSRKESEDLGLEILRKVFFEVKCRRSLGEFKAQELSNLSNNAFKLMVYVKKGMGDLEGLGLYVLCKIFREINGDRDLGEFVEQEIENVTYNGWKLVVYGQHRGLREVEELGVQVLFKMFYEMKRRASWGEFDEIELSRSCGTGVELVNYWKDGKSEELALEVLWNVFQEIKGRDLSSLSAGGVMKTAERGIRFVNYGKEKGLVLVEGLGLEILWKIFEEVDCRESLWGINWHYFLPDRDYVLGAAYVIFRILKSKLSSSEVDLVYVDVRRVCEIAWVFSVMDLRSFDCWFRSFFSLLNEREVELIDLESCGRLYEVYLNKSINEGKWDSRAPSGFLTLEESMPKELGLRILEVMVERSHIVKEEMRLEWRRGVGEELGKILGEKKVQEGPYVWPYEVDFGFVDKRGRRGLVELKSSKELSDFVIASEFRGSLLKKMGYRVVNIDMEDWSEAEDKKGFLERSLVGAGFRIDDLSVVLPARYQRRRGHAKKKAVSGDGDDTFEDGEV